jgi:cardiolipin synthase
LILDGDLKVGFWVFLAAAVSDALDGIIAKTFNSETVIGAYIDPIADKALLVGTFITLGHEGFLQTWLVILVVFRDIVIVGGALIFQTVTQSLTMRPMMISKVNTVVQLLLAISVLFVAGYGIEDGPVIGVMGYIVAVTTLWSGTAYVITWSKLAADMENAGHPGE